MITNDEEHAAALKRVDELWGKGDLASRLELDALVDAIEAYEEATIPID